ncbi:HTH_48 domain-containing protein [Trichonephila clavipes]|nr:HTH_48 domain-containing protein [Trichonephila clavipes]
MFKTSADPTDSEVRFLIRFLKRRDSKPVEIYRQLVEIYGENVMSEEKVWVRQFNEEQTNIHDDTRSGGLSVVHDGLVEKLNEKIR